MKEIRFEIAKRMTRPPKNTQGLILRSMEGNPSSASALLYDPSGYRVVKEKLAEKRLLGAFSSELSLRSKGRALELSSEGEGALFSLMTALVGLPFESEDALDLMEFFAFLLSEASLAPVSPLDPAASAPAAPAASASPAAPTSNRPSSSPASPASPFFSLVSLSLGADGFSLAAAAYIEEGNSPETIYGALAPILGKCRMGIIKKRPEPLA